MFFFRLTPHDRPTPHVPRHPAARSALALAIATLLIAVLACGGGAAPGDGGGEDQQPRETRGASEATPAAADTTPTARVTSEEPESPTETATTGPGATATNGPAATAETAATAEPTPGLKPQMANTSAETDREMLTAFFEATNGEAWDRSGTWLSQRPVADWDGVTTDEDGRVVELRVGIRRDDADASSLVEPLAQLQNLVRLEKLEIQAPMESIPREWGALSGLKSLRIYGDGFKGSVPDHIFQLENLTELAVSGGEMQVELSEAVEGLFLSGAKVEMEIAGVTGCLSELAQQLNPGQPSLPNPKWQMAGRARARQGIPERIAGAPVCENVHQGDADTLAEIYDAWGGAGALPNWLTRQPLHQWEGVTTDRDGRVVGLELGPNTRPGMAGARMGGPLGSDVIHEAIGKLSALRYLNLGRLRLTGEIPEWLSQLTDLRELDLSENQLTGEIPESLAGLTQLRVLNLSQNSLSGEVPAFLSNLPEIRWLNLWGNFDLTGCLPQPEGRDDDPLMLEGAQYCP